MQMLSRLFAGLAILSMAMVLLSSVVTIADILARLLSLPPVAGIIDITQFFMMYAVFFAVAHAFAARGHVAITILTDRMPRRVDRAFGVLWWLAAVGMCLVLSRAAIAQALTVWDYGDRSQTLGWPMIVYWIPVAAGLAVSGLGAVLAAVAEWRGAPPGAAGLH